MQSQRFHAGSCSVSLEWALFSNAMFLVHHVCALPYGSHTLRCCLPSFLPVLRVYFLKASSYQTYLFIVVLEVLWALQIPSHSRAVLWLLHSSSQLNGEGWRGHRFGGRISSVHRVLHGHCRSSAVARCGFSSIALRAAVVSPG